MIYFFYTIHVMICIFLILVVLLQQGKGADLSVFGGGGTMTAFGARGAATVLHKLTVGSFVAFMVTTLAIGVLEGQRENSSVMSDVIEAPVDEADVPVEPAGALVDEDEDDATNDGDNDGDNDGSAAAGSVSEDGSTSEETASGEEGVPLGNETESDDS